MSTLGEIMSTSGRYHDACGGYHEYVQYIGVFNRT